MVQQVDSVEFIIDFHVPIPKPIWDDPQKLTLELISDVGYAPLSFDITLAYPEFLEHITPNEIWVEKKKLSDGYDRKYRPKELKPLPLCEGYRTDEELVDTRRRKQNKMLEESKKLGQLAGESHAQRVYMQRRSIEIQGITDELREKVKDPAYNGNPGDCNPLFRFSLYFMGTVYSSRDGTLWVPCICPHWGYLDYRLIPVPTWDEWEINIYNAPKIHDGDRCVILR